MTKFSGSIQNTLIDKVQKHLSGTIYEKLILNEIESWDEGAWDLVKKSRTHRPIIDIHNLEELYKNTTIYKSFYSSNISLQVIMPTSCLHKDIFINLNKIAQCLPENSIFILICNISNNQIFSIDTAIKLLEKYKLSYKIILTHQTLDYRQNLHFGIKDSKINPRYTCFADDDAFITKDDHFDILMKELDNNQVEAVSGVALDKNNDQLLHDFFNIGSNLEMYEDYNLKHKVPDKPHIHGGGGVTLMRTVDFKKRLDEALSKGYLFGPLVSGYARRENKIVKSMASLPVLHPTKSKFIDWLLTIKKYNNTWSRLIRIDNIDNSYYRNKYLPQFEKSLKDYGGDSHKIFKVLQKFRRSLYDL